MAARPAQAVGAPSLNERTVIMGQNPNKIAQDKIRTLNIERRYYKTQKIVDSDMRWLLGRSERLVVADEILTANGYAVDEPGYQLPLSRG